MKEFDQAAVDAHMQRFCSEASRGTQQKKPSVAPKLEAMLAELDEFVEWREARELERSRYEQIHHALDH